MPNPQSIHYGTSARYGRLIRALLVSVFVTLVALSLFAGSGGRRAAALSSCNTGQLYFHDITLDAGGFARTDKPAEVNLDLTPLLAAQGGSGAINLNSLCVDEMDGGVIDNNVPFQFDPFSNYNATTKARGVLTILMTGNTADNATRSYRLHFDTAGGFSAPSFTDQVTLTDGVSHKGYQSIHIVTAVADYYYHKPGGGFATLFDADSNDWIDWNTASGGSGDFRGIPNMVHPNDGGYFHPGRTGIGTAVLRDGPLKASFRSTSNNGDWEVRWDIFPTYARMTVVKAGSANYWWLYEGVPGGSLETSGGNADRLTRSNGDSITAAGTWTTDIPGDEWVFVTDQSTERSLYLIHHQEDTKVDGYKPDTGGAMTIFGFGRNGNLRLLSDKPNQFTFGFVDETNINGVRPVVNDAYKPLNITGSNDSGDDGGGGGPVCNSQPYVYYLSPKGNVTIDGVTYPDEDVLKYDANTCEWSSIFDGTAAGLPASANVDALAVDGTDLYLSFLAKLNVPGLGLISDSDVVKYDGTAFSLYFDGSLYGLSVAAEDVDAIAFDTNGDLLVSTSGSYTVPGLPKGQDEDLLRVNGGVLGVYLDGSQNAGLGPEDIVGADVATNGDIYLSVLDAFNLSGMKGNGTDIFRCVPGSVGNPTTNCTYNLFWNSAEHGLKAFDAFDIE